MTRRLLALLMLLSCGLAVPGGYVIDTVLLRSGGLTRSYVVVRPTHTTGALPVLVELQGCCTTPYVEIARSGFLTATDRKAILVFPAGYRERWNAGACCGSTSVDDVAFLTAVIARVSPRSPVYLAGYSNGGRMAYRMACERPGLLAGVAVFGAVSAFPCPGPAPVPFLIAAGTDDPELTVPAAGIPHMVGGLLEPSVTGQASLYAEAGGPVTVLLYTGGDHTWPDDMAEVMWHFFRSLPLAVRARTGLSPPRPSLRLSNGSAERPSCCPVRRPGRPLSWSCGGWPAAGRPY